jgi:hypothetical protein
MDEIKIIRNTALKVHLLEYLTGQEITRYIIHADILLMVRAKDLKL